MSAPCPLCEAVIAPVRRRARRRAASTWDRELRLQAVLASRGLTLRPDGSLYNVLDGAALVIDGAALDQLERWFDLEEYV